jgi:hypothetical protein
MPISSTQVSKSQVSNQEDLFRDVSQNSLFIGKLISDYLTANPGWHSKETILTATNFPEKKWSVTISDLLEAGKIERIGEKRGARYKSNATLESPE